jgi:hypothetical protein
MHRTLPARIAVPSCASELGRASLPALALALAVRDGLFALAPALVTASLAACGSAASRNEAKPAGTPCGGTGICVVPSASGACGDGLRSIVDDPLQPACAAGALCCAPKTVDCVSAGGACLPSPGDCSRGSGHLGSDGVDCSSDQLTCCFPESRCGGTETFKCCTLMFETRPTCDGTTLRCPAGTPAAIGAACP